MVFEGCGWAGALLVLLSIYLVGERYRWGFFCGAVGEVFWVVYAWGLESWSLGLMGVIYGIMYLHSFFRWKQTINDQVVAWERPGFYLRDDLATGVREDEAYSFWKAEWKRITVFKGSRRWAIKEAKKCMNSQ